MSATEQAAAPSAAAKRKTEYTTVKMTDGREVEFPYNSETGKGRQLDKQSLIPGSDSYTGPAGVRLDFVNGETRFFELPGAQFLVELFSDSDFGPKARFIVKAALHGLEQKLGDEIAYSPKKDEPPPTIEDKVEWTDELLGRLNQLEWTTQRAADPLAGVSTLVKALMELSGKGKGEIREFIKPMSREERAKMRLTPVVKAKIEEIEAAALATKGVDVSDKLEALGISGGEDAED